MLSMVLGGFYLGVAYETYRHFTPYWKHRPFFVYFLETSFWLSQTGLLFFLLYKVNAGELRLYIFFACLLGFSIYQVVAAPIYRKILDYIIRMTVMILRMFHAILIRPLIWLFSFSLSILRFIGRVVQGMFSIVLIPMKGLGQFVYRLLPVKIIRKIKGVYSTIENIYNRAKAFIFKGGE